MPKVKMVRDVQVGGEPHFAGDVVDVTDEDYRLVVHAGTAVPFDKKALAAAKAKAAEPQPAEPAAEESDEEGEPTPE
jgi:hypothetical protein